MNSLYSSAAIPDQMIEPSICKRQDEWGDILDNKALMEDSQLFEVDRSFDNMYLIRSLRQKLSTRSIAQLSKTWFDTAVHGTHIRIPQAERDLSKYLTYESIPWSVLVNISVWFLVIGPFLASPFCGYSEPYHVINIDDGITGGSGNSNGGIPIGLLSALYLICSLIQLYDVYLWFKSTSWDILVNDRSRLQIDKSHIWTSVRGIVSLAIFMDCTVYFFLTTIPRITRCLAPIVLIARRENLKLIIEGFIMSLRESLPVLRMLTLVLIMWAFVGFVVFRRIDSSAQYSHFGTYPNSLLTTLHCFASRPTVLYRVLILWDRTESSALYFVLLTVFADMIVGAFLVAVGNRHYRDFYLLTFRRRLMYRRKALIALFHLYSDKQQLKSSRDYQDSLIADLNTGGMRQSSLEISRYFLSRSQWLTFCGDIAKDFDSIFNSLKNKMQIVFDLEDTCGTGFVDVRSFFRMSAVLHTLLHENNRARVPTDRQSQSQSKSVLEGMIGPESSSSNRPPSLWVGPKGSSSSSINSVRASDSCTESQQPPLLQAQKQSQQVQHPPKLLPLPRFSEQQSAATAGSFSTSLTLHTRGSLGTSLLSRPTQDSTTSTAAGVKKPTSIAFSEREAIDLDGDRAAPLGWLGVLCATIEQFSISLPNCCGVKMWKVNVLYMTNFLAHILLIVQLSFISQKRPSYSW